MIWLKVFSVIIYLRSFKTYAWPTGPKEGLQPIDSLSTFSLQLSPHDKATLVSPGSGSKEGSGLTDDSRDLQLAIGTHPSLEDVPRESGKAKMEGEEDRVPGEDQMRDPPQAPSQVHKPTPIKPPPPPKPFEGLKQLAPGDGITLPYASGIWFPDQGPNIGKSRISSASHDRSLPDLNDLPNQDQPMQFEVSFRPFKKTKVYGANGETGVRSQGQDGLSVTPVVTTPLPEGHDSGRAQLIGTSSTHRQVLSQPISPSVSVQGSRVALARIKNRKLPKKQVNEQRDESGKAPVADSPHKTPSGESSDDPIHIDDGPSTPTSNFVAMFNRNQQARIAGKARPRPGNQHKVQGSSSSQPSTSVQELALNRKTVQSFLDRLKGHQPSSQAARHPGLAPQNPRPTGLNSMPVVEGHPSQVLSGGLSRTHQPTPSVAAQGHTTNSINQIARILSHSHFHRPLYPGDLGRATQSSLRSTNSPATVATLIGATHAGQPSTLPNEPTMQTFRNSPMFDLITSRAAEIQATLNARHQTLNQKATNPNFKDENPQL